MFHLRSGTLSKPKASILETHSPRPFFTVKGSHHYSIQKTSNYGSSLCLFHTSPINLAIRAKRPSLKSKPAENLFRNLEDDSKSNESPKYNKEINARENEKSNFEQSKEKNKKYSTEKDDKKNKQRNFGNSFDESNETRDKPWQNRDTKKREFSRDRDNNNKFREQKYDSKDSKEGNEKDDLYRNKDKNFHNNFYSRENKRDEERGYKKREGEFPQKSFKDNNNSSSNNNNNNRFKEKFTRREENSSEEGEQRSPQRSRFDRPKSSEKYQKDFRVERKPRREYENEDLDRYEYKKDLAKRWEEKSPQNFRSSERNNYSNNRERDNNFNSEFPRERREWGRERDNNNHRERDNNSEYSREKRFDKPRLGSKFNYVLYQNNMIFQAMNLLEKSYSGDFVSLDKLMQSKSLDANWKTNEKFEYLYGYRSVYSALFNQKRSKFYGLFLVSKDIRNKDKGPKKYDEEDGEEEEGDEERENTNEKNKDEENEKEGGKEDPSVELNEKLYNEILEMAKSRNIPLIHTNKQQLNHFSSTIADSKMIGRHQGVVLCCSPFPVIPITFEVENSSQSISNSSSELIDNFDILQSKLNSVLPPNPLSDQLLQSVYSFNQNNEKKVKWPIWLMLDRVQDPNNLGGIFRTCSFLGFLFS